ncbi:hypothetical protein C8039_15920 [Halogeometricum sp. wsp3]|nr:hypothetical protein C8039_15920 [Halogeometricum sp. wsp3]
MLHPEDCDRIWETVQDALADHGEFEVTYRIVTKDDQTKWMWERGQAICEDGELVALKDSLRNHRPPGARAQMDRYNDS